MLAWRVRVEQPLEIGTDFVARRFHVYATHTASYAAAENPPEAPAELEEMRESFREEKKDSWRPQDFFADRILARSLLQPSWKVYPGKPLDGANVVQFVIVDPSLTRQDLDEWAALLLTSEPASS